VAVVQLWEPGHIYCRPGRCRERDGRTRGTASVPDDAADTPGTASTPKNTPTGRAGDGRKDTRIRPHKLHVAIRNVGRDADRGAGDPDADGPQRVYGVSRGTTPDRERSIRDRERRRATTGDGRGRGAVPAGSSARQAGWWHWSLVSSSQSDTSCAVPPVAARAPSLPWLLVHRPSRGCSSRSPPWRGCVSRRPRRRTAAFDRPMTAPLMRCRTRSASGASRSRSSPRGTAPRRSPPRGRRPRAGRVAVALIAPQRRRLLTLR